MLLPSPCYARAEQNPACALGACSIGDVEVDTAPARFDPSTSPHPGSGLWWATLASPHHRLPPPTRSGVEVRAGGLGALV